MDLACRRIQANEIEAAHEILKLCGQDMKMRLGLGHWDPPYPLALWRKSVEECEVFVVLNDGQLIATFTPGTEAPAYYRTIPGAWDAWDPAGEPAIYVSRLAVLPAFQRQGVGTWCMYEVELAARRKGCKSVRLDAYDQHRELVEWYQHLGYQGRGVFSFHTKVHGETGMICLEKRLENL